MHNKSIFTLPCIFTQNMFCKVMLALLRRPYVVTVEKKSKYSKLLVMVVKNVKCFKAINVQKLKHFMIFFDDASKNL